jgi:hypothetical protein
MEVGDTGWNGHQWQAQPRQHRIGACTSVLHRHCVRCGRDFLTDLTSRRSRAAFGGAASFYQLDDTVTERWLREFCPGTHLLDDDEDRKRIIAELFLFSEEPGDRLKSR